MSDAAPREPNHIHVLSAQLANQIAAGEVVERPASVVKELIENCLDAGASSIQIEVDQGGHKRILVRDDGSGIAKEQLELALSRHATSKIYDIDDLECISSMGFRGEALASISSVSRLTLTSKPANQDTAWQAQAEGLEMAVTLSPAAHPKGTSIEVLDLFFNTPARRKFLRAAKTEFQHIEQIFRRIAMAYPHIAFSLKHNDKLVHKLQATELNKRVLALCGNSFLQDCAQVDYHHQTVSLSGWCVGLGKGGITTDNQYIFVNQRMVRDKLIMHAIRQAYEGMLADNTYPAYVLFLNLPAQDMDINVHPAKHEVRFHQARQVHDVIFQAVSQAILHHQKILEQGTDGQGQNNTDIDAQSVRTNQASHDYIRPLQSISSDVSDAAAHALPSKMRAPFPSDSARPAYSKDASSANIAESANAYHQLMTPANAEASTPTFLLVQNWLVLQADDGLSLVALSDVYEQFFKESLAKATTPQPLLMPISINLQDLSHKELIEAMKSMGFVIEKTTSRLILKQVPSALRALPWAHIFASITEQSHCANNAYLVRKSIAEQFIQLNPPSHANVAKTLESLTDQALNDLLNERACKISPKDLTKLYFDSMSSSEV
jgi:DNA mismatch repair protein MutL